VCDEQGTNEKDKQAALPANPFPSEGLLSTASWLSGGRWDGNPLVPAMLARAPGSKRTVQGLEVTLLHRRINAL